MLAPEKEALHFAQHSLLQYCTRTKLKRHNVWVCKPPVCTPVKIWANGTIEMHYTSAARRYVMLTPQGYYRILPLAELNMYYTLKDGSPIGTDDALLRHFARRNTLDWFEVSANTEAYANVYFVPLDRKKGIQTVWYDSSGAERWGYAIANCMGTSEYHGNGDFVVCPLQGTPYILSGYEFATMFNVSSWKKAIKGLDTTAVVIPKPTQPLWSRKVRQQEGTSNV